jgi:Putative transposase/Transposase zinc-binding domain
MGLLQELFRTHGPAYLERFGLAMPKAHKRVIAAIADCHTEAAGSALYVCDGCGHRHVVHRSCGNRHCPCCQQGKGHEWLERQRARQLPGEHFLLTFTVPEPLRPFLRQHQKLGYGALFAASAGAIKALAADPRHIGGNVTGFFGVLHTWGRTLQYHPHIHYVVVGGALSSEDGRWHPARPGFYLPVRALSRIVRAKFRDRIDTHGLLGAIPGEVWSTEWNVNCQAAGDGSEALQYLAPYVFKVAISERRILGVDDDHVRFRYQKPHSTRVRTMTLPIMEFMRRFLQHVLPRGFMKVRYYGFLSPSASVPLADVKARIEMASGFALAAPEITSEPPVALRCRHCGGALRFSRLLLAGDSALGGLASLGQRAAAPSPLVAVPVGP